MDAASSKSHAVSELLDAFNKGNYLKCKDLNAELLKADLERNKHVTKALNTQITSVDTTLEQFIGESEEFAPDYKKSSFYIVGKSDKFIEDFAALQPVIDCRRIYENFYNDKMEELTERIAREKLIHEQKEKDFLNDVQRCIESARNGLLRHISTLTFGSTLTKPQDDFLEAKPSLDERAKAFNTKPDFSAFYKFYREHADQIKGMWDAQINKAKWKAPVNCQGKLKCKNGHKIDEGTICCINKLPKAKEDGSDVCGGIWYWVDGPSRFAKCKGPCGQVQKMPSSLTCFKCGAECLCEIRPSVYYP